MPEEHETIEARLSASPEVYRHTKFMARFEKAFPWLLVGVAALGLIFMIFLPGAFFQKETAEQRLSYLKPTARILTTALNQTQTLKPPLKTKSTKRKFSKNKSGNSTKMLSKNVKQNAESGTPKR